MKQLLKNILHKIPYINGLKTQVDNYKENACFPPGHFYSPIVSVEDIKSRESTIWSETEKDRLPDIRFNVAEQKTLMGELANYYEDIPFKGDGQLRYSFENGMYSYTDGIVLYGIMRHFKPKRIMEIGSGHSSALMLDVNELHFDDSIHLTFIEPYPDRLYKTIADADKKNAKIIEKKVQDVDLAYFEDLADGDILFVDSTHVSKYGSDVNHILFRVLPVLASGVLIHFHDVFYPFEYPKEWVYKGYNWNENYMLRAFLQNNDQYEMVLFSHFLHEHHKEVFESMPDAYKNKGGNLWLRKN